jgi:hypothetical protein
MLTLKFEEDKKRNSVRQKLRNWEVASSSKCEDIRMT